MGKKAHKNILLVWDRMGDYHRARWKALEERFPDRKIFAADLGGSDKLYGWNSTELHKGYLLLSPKLPDQFDVRRLVTFARSINNNDIGIVCLAGYGKVEYLLFMLYARLKGCRVILFAESWYPSSFFATRVKSFYLRMTTHGLLVSGIRAKNHFINVIHFPERNVKIGYSVVDNKHFNIRYPRRFSKQMLCVARFANEKNLEHLINSFQKSELPGMGWRLRVVGGGPLKQQLMGITEQSLSVELMDWRPYNELPAVYYQADVFILPSMFEPWGLVVNEAMAASLPVMLSDAVGCLPDLLKKGVNGFSFSPSGDALVALMNRISKLSAEEFHKMGEESALRIRAFDLDVFSLSVQSLIEQ